MSAEFGIKARKHGEKGWWFLKPGGAMTRVKIHASRFTSDDAQQAMATLTPNNLDYEFKKVALR